MKKREIFPIFTFFVLSFFFLPPKISFAQSTDQITLTTYYPAPFGAYDRVKLVPRSSTGMPCAANGDDNGTMYFDSSSKDVMACKDGTYYSISSLGGGWTVDSSISPHRIYPTDSAAYVGIGTSAAVIAGAKLHVYDTLSPTSIKIQSVPGGFGTSQLEFWSNAQGDAQEWRPGYIKSTDAGTYTGGLAFVTNGTGVGSKTGSLEAMRIVNGNVGIGTMTSPSVPSAPLDVDGVIALRDGGKRNRNGGMVSEVSAALVNFGINEGSGNRFGTAGGGYSSSNQGGLFRVDTRSGYNLFQFLGRPAGTTGDALEMVSITSVGNVGIGTISPKNILSKLHIIGTTFIDNSGWTHGLTGNAGLIVDSASGEDIARFRDNSANEKFVVQDDGDLFRNSREIAVFNNRCNDGTRNGGNDKYHEAWCGPTDTRIDSSFCVPFVIVQDQNDNDQDQVLEHGCYIDDTADQLFSALETTGDDDENTADGDFRCGAICGLKVVKND